MVHYFQPFPSFSLFGPPIVGLAYSVKTSLGRFNIVMIVEVKFQTVTLDESQPTSELQDAYNEVECGNRGEEAIEKLPDIVRDVEEYIYSDASFVRTTSPDDGKDVQASWSKEVLSSEGSPEDELAGNEPRDYWNSNDKDCTDEMTVTVNPMYVYGDESDASSQSLVEDQLEVFSSVDDVRSKGHSSVAEPIDLSDTEQPLLTVNETTGSFEAEQTITETQQNVVTTRGMEKSTETLKDMPRITVQDLGRDVDGSSGEEMLDKDKDEPEIVDVTVRGQLTDPAENINGDKDEDEIYLADVENSKIDEGLSTEVPEHTYMPPAELISELSYTTDQVFTGEEALQELDAYLSSVVVADEQKNLDDDNNRTSTEDAAVSDDGDEDDAMMENSFNGKDDNDIINFVGTTADVNDVEKRDELDVDQTDHSYVEDPASCSVKHLHRDPDGACSDEVGQLDNSDVYVKNNQHEPGFPENQTAVRVCEHQNFDTASDVDEAVMVHEETAAEDLDKGVGQTGLVENSGSRSSTQFADVTSSVLGDQTYNDAVVSDCHSNLPMTELVGDDVKLADAEVDAIFSGAVERSLDDQDRCSIRRVSDHETYDTNTCVQLSQTSDTSDTDDIASRDATTSFLVTHKQQQLSAEERLEADNNEDSNENGTSKTNRMNLPCLHASEVPDIEDQSERDGMADVARDGEGLDMQEEITGISISHLLHRQVEISNDYIVDECEAESDRTSSDLEMSLPVEPSYEIREVDSESAYFEADGNASKPVEECQLKDHASAVTYISSPGSNLSWRSCTPRVCDPENTEDHIKPESVPMLHSRGVTTSQVAAYHKLCEERLTATTLIDYSEKMQNEPAEKEDENASFPYVDAVDTLPPENLGSKTHHRLLNASSSLPECHCSDCGDSCCGSERRVQQNEHVDMKLKTNETSVEEGSEVDEDLDETGECDPDEADSCVIDVTLTNCTSECSKISYYLCCGYALCALSRDIGGLTPTRND